REGAGEAVVRKFEVGGAEGAGTGPRDGLDGYRHLGQASAVVVLVAEVLPRHVVAQEVSPSPRDLGRSGKHLWVVDEAEYLREGVRRQHTHTHAEDERDLPAGTVRLVDW